MNCTCHMDGSYITNCPTHGKRISLAREAERKVRVMSTEELEAFLRVIGPLEAT